MEQCTHNESPLFYYIGICARNPENETKKNCVRLLHRAHSLGSATFSRFSAYEIFRVKPKCSAMDGLSFSVLIDGFPTISTLEGFSKHPKAYGNYKLYELKYIGCTVTI